MKRARTETMVLEEEALWAKEIEDALREDSSGEEKETQPEKKSTKKQAIFTVIKALLFALILAGLFYLMEFYEHDPFQEVRPKAQLYNILLFELFGWGLFCLFGRARTAIAIEGWIACIFGLANHYVTLFRSTPLTPWDFFSIKTAASVAGNYDFMPSRRVVIVTLIFILVIFASLWLNFRWKKKIYYRILPVFAITGILVWFSGLLQDYDFQVNNYLYPFLFTPAYMTQVNGITVTFVMDLAYVKIDKPDGYSQAKAEELIEEYQTRAEAAAHAASAAGEDEKPNIIVIMDEAFSDLSLVGDLDTNEDYMPFVHSLQEGADNVRTGYLNVSVCGGNTANTEFEFLTGNTMAFLPSGSIPYQQYIKSETPSMASYLASLGYETVGMHPYLANGWDRSTVYPLLGFQTCRFIYDLKCKNYVRNYVSDASDFDNIIDTYEEKEAGQPLFYFNVTMQNHGGYTETYENLSNTIYAESIDSDQLDQYLTLISMTDHALESLCNYFSQQEEPTIIVFFGDHQPSNNVTNAIPGSAEDQTLRYQVPYIIWANYDIQEASGNDTSVNFLASQVLETAGIPLDGYHYFLKELNTYYPIYSAVRQEEADGLSEDEEAKAAELLQEYKIMQYYYLFDYQAEVESTEE